MNNTYILILKGTNKDLATTEFETLFKTYYNKTIKLKQIHNTIYTFKSEILITKSDEFLTRLTFTNHLSISTFKGTFEKFQKEIPNLNLSKYDGKEFAVKQTRIKKDFQPKIQAKFLAKPIFDSFKNPKINLEKPKIEFYFFFESENKFYFAEKIYENNKDYLRRMPKLRPVVMPYTLKSDMARASINLLALKNGTILDPFCGIGGILLEAKDMNFEIIGNDISWNDLKYFKQNFNHFFPNSKYNITLADSRTQFLKENSIDAIVSDIPYGRASRKLGTDLYEQFLISSKKYLKPNARMILIYANFVEFKQLALKQFKEIKEIDQYINKSMTRHILILENNK